MVKELIASAIVAGVASVAAAAHSSEGRKMTEEEKNILATVEARTSSLEKGDVDGIMSTYRDGAAIMFEPGQSVTDSSIARQIFSQMTAAKPEVSYSGHEVYVSGDTAVHIAPWSMVGTAPDGTKIEQAGLSVAVLRVQADGSWKMVIDNPYGARLLAE